MTTKKTDLYSMTDTELADFFVSLGEAKFRAKQVFPRLQAGDSIDEITTLSKPLREKLREITLDTLPQVELILLLINLLIFSSSHLHSPSVE